MKEFAEKLIERLEGESYLTTNDDGETDKFSVQVVEWKDIKKIANDLASEHNNGWIEKLLEAKKNCGEDSDCSECPFGQIEDRCILTELQIEKDNGWIPCSERLPELTEGTECFKQSKCCLVTLEWWDGDMTESVGWYNQSGVWNDDSKNCKVIAWMELPAPYKKGE